MSSPPRLALIEDHQDLREELQTYLKSQGFPIWAVGSAEDFYKALTWQQADVVLVDLTLPGEDGLQVIKHLHQHSPCGIIAVTARGERDDRLLGLELGVDHYLVKPVDLEELAAVIQSLWRRMANKPVNIPTTTQGPWQLDAVSRTLHCPEGNALTLTDKEYAVLEHLLQHSSQVLSKEDLHQAVFPSSGVLDPHRIEVILSRIRKKAKLAGIALPIRAIFGKGLVFVQPG